jgi:hypothetical protein
VRSKNVCFGPHLLEEVVLLIDLNLNVTNVEFEKRFRALSSKFLRFELAVLSLSSTK